jgi:hypothetical protein
VKSLGVAIVFLAFTLRVTGQTAPTNNNQAEELMSELEDIAMCHHAIESARHQVAFQNQNAYYRYLLMDSFGDYPKAERCEAVTKKWAVDYATQAEEDKKSLDSVLKEKFGTTFPEIASDAKFMSVVTLYKAMGESRWRTLDSPDAIK